MVTNNKLNLIMKELWFHSFIGDPYKVSLKYNTDLKGCYRSGYFSITFNDGSIKVYKEYCNDLQQYYDEGMVWSQLSGEV